MMEKKVVYCFDTDSDKMFNADEVVQRSTGHGTVRYWPTRTITAKSKIYYFHSRGCNDIQVSE